MQQSEKQLNSALAAAYPLPQLPESLSAQAVEAKLAGKRPQPSVRIYVLRTVAAAAVFMLVAGLAVMSPFLLGGMGGAAAESESAGENEAGYGYMYDASASSDAATGGSPEMAMDDKRAATVHSYCENAVYTLTVGESISVQLDDAAGDFVISYTDCESGEENTAVCSAWFTAMEGEPLLLWVEGSAPGCVEIRVCEALLLDHKTPREYTLIVNVEAEVPHAD
ncbi:MAG: hypothetical protein IJP01_00655 [Oscillospiraceae bacterium]|nr:hypothetical protein [Oscillospiraceae bacterium]